jgi:endonuclease-8
VPEGDTIYAVCQLLSAELTGAGPVRVRLRRLDAGVLCGRTIVRLWSKGKHLFMGFDNGLVLRSHLGLYGSWHRYAPGEPWRKPEWQASVVVEDGAQVFVCFNAREVELLADRGFPLADAQHRLGPDLTREAPDAGELARRARTLLDPGLPLADLLLDQRVASGIGNVYKCEVLFLEGRHPLETLRDTPDRALAGLYAQARDLLGRNLAGGPRVTRFVDDGRGRLWVYGRHGEPCLRCGETLRRERLGFNPRPTWWCPGCQPPAR